MIDTDKYEGHSTGWKHKINHSTYSIINDDGQKVASVPCYEECNKDSQLIADAPLLLAEVKRLRSGMQDILDDFETTKTDMWSIIKRIQEMIE
jgi:hypothetical protein|tara:strand:+ start:17 stop:295 length:279 start_codon:yes stop_codon:yes gene_type:complete